MSIKQVKTYREYLLSQDDNESHWGWFVDIETEANIQKTLQIKNSIYIPPTIYEETHTIINKSETKTPRLFDVTCIITIIYAFIIILA